MPSSLQTFLGLFLAMVAVLRIGGDFKEIRSAVELSAKSWENARNRPSFYGFNHRAKALHPDYLPPFAPVQHQQGSGGGGGGGGGGGLTKRSATEIPERFLS